MGSEPISLTKTPPPFGRVPTREKVNLSPIGREGRTIGSTRIGRDWGYFQKGWGRRTRVPDNGKGEGDAKRSQWEDDLPAPLGGLRDFGERFRTESPAFQPGIQFMREGPNRAALLVLMAVHRQAFHLTLTPHCAFTFPR